MSDTTDIVIVGGGPVGAALALALAAGGVAPLLLESRQAFRPASDPRPIALSYGSRLVLERLGLWQQLASATPIERIHVSQQGGFGRVALAADEAGLPALGYVVDYARLHAAFAHALAERGPEVLAGANVRAVRPGALAAEVDFEFGGAVRTMAAKLVVVADGGALQDLAATKIVDYRQTAVTTLVASELPHRNVAFERFTAAGPLALLPCGERLALIWTADPARARALTEMPEHEFLAQLGRHFGGRLGAFAAAGVRNAFPLALRVARTVAGPHWVVIGNAAQALHPVAGQGFNLGLRDAWELGDAIMRAARDGLGGTAMLNDYRARRRIDRGGGVWFTDTLVRLFSNDIAALRVARGAGLAALGCLPALKDFVVRRMTFGARG